MTEARIQEQQLDLFTTKPVPAEQIVGSMTDEIRQDGRVWPATLAELVDVIAEYLGGLPLFDSDRSLELAQEIILVIAHHLGGQSIYLPRDDKLKRAVRDAAIYRAFDGSNQRELAKKAGLTPTRIYAIIAEQRRLREDRRQMPLPFPE